MREKPHTKKPQGAPQLSKRERQIVDFLLENGEGSAEEVRASLPNPPGNSAVRSTLAKLEQRGLITHSEEGLRYVYRVAIPKSEARGTAMQRLIRVFFDGSATAAVAGLLDHASQNASPEELDELAELIESAKRGRKQ